MLFVGIENDQIRVAEKLWCIEKWIKIGQMYIFFFRFTLLGSNKYVEQF